MLMHRASSVDCKMQMAHCKIEWMCGFQFPHLSLRVVICAALSVLASEHKNLVSDVGHYLY